MYVSNTTSMTSNISLHVLKMTISAAEKKKKKKKKRKERKRLYLMQYKYDKLPI
jgi:hypothetical protein